MSTVALQPSESLPTPKTRISTGILAFGDQLLISGTNFITMVLMARGLGSAADFGVFVLVYSILLFANSLQSALITQPHNVLGASRHGDDYVRYTSSTAVNQVALVLVLAAFVLVAWGIGLVVGWANSAMLLAMAGTIVAWQLQEFSRRVLYTENRITTAFMVDMVAYGGQTLAIFTWWWSGALTGALALVSIMVASAVAAGIGFWQLRGSLGWEYDPHAMKENWRFGKWLAGGYIVGNWLSSQFLIFVAAGLLGTWAAGVLRAAHTVFGPMRILAQALSTTLPTRLVKTLNSHGVAGFRREVRQTFLFLIPLFAIYCVLVASFSKSILTLAFGEAYSNYDDLLAVYAISAFIGYMCIVFSANLRATQRTREIFLCELCSTLVVVPLSVMLVPLWGVFGVVVGMIATDLLLMGLLYNAYQATLRKLSSGEPPQGGKPNVQMHDALAIDTKCSLEPGGALTCRGSMLSKVLKVFERNSVEYCILHGYQTYPESVPSDVDCIVNLQALKCSEVSGSLNAALKELLGDRLTLVQWIQGGAHGIVLRSGSPGEASAFLQLDLSDGLHLNKRIPFYSGAEILKGRQRHKEFYIPAPEIEFGCSLIRRVIKQSISSSHALHLSELYQKHSAACGEQVFRFFGKRSGDMISTAADSGDWQPVVARLRELKRELIIKAVVRRPFQVGLNFIQGAVRRARRWFKPTGFHLVLLGPDGAGKSSVAAGVRQSLGPVFLDSNCRSFPPRLLNRPVGDPSAPHKIKPRSAASSVLRAVGYWWTYYSPGYYFTVYPALVRGSLVLHDRHVIDCIVDPVRYRYAGPKWLLRCIWRCIPRPKLVVLLDVPAEILQSRKQEVPFEVSQQQRIAYRDLVEAMPNGKIIDGAQPLERVIANVCDAILELMAERCHKQLELQARS